MDLRSIWQGFGCDLVMVRRDSGNALERICNGFGSNAMSIWQESATDSTGICSEFCKGLLMVFVKFG